MKRFIIIGAGILGATTAYKLAKQGQEVLLIDRTDVGQATDAAAGIICPWLSQRRNKFWYHLAKNGARIYPELVAELESDGEIDTGYSMSGGLSLHHDEKKLIAMQERALKRKEDAPEMGEVTLLDHTQTRELFPLVGEDYASIHVSGAAKVDGRVFRNALINGAKKYGAKLLQGTASLSFQEGRVHGVLVEEKIYEADQIIATCGAWMNELLQPIGVNFQSWGQKGQIIHVDMPVEEAVNWPVVMPPTSQSIVPFGNRMVIGATHENDTGYDPRVTVGGIHDILSKALEVMPAIANCALLEARVGFRPFTPGFLPVIGKLPDIEGVLVANGLGSSGLTTGPFVGIQLAKLALGEELDINLENYDVRGAIE